MRYLRQRQSGREGEAPARSAQPAAPGHPLLALQKSAGNRATRLAIRAPGDLQEREADELARAALDGPSAPLKIQVRQNDASLYAETDTAEAIAQQSGGGEPL